jgi:Domain of unknown function (DUF4340)
VSPKHFISLAVAAAVSAGVASLLYTTKNRWATGSASGEALLPALATRANDVASLQLLQGEKSLTIQRQGDVWSLKERDGYVALPDKVRTLVVQLAQSKLAERKTQSAQRHSTLELEDPLLKDAKSRMVRLLDASGRNIGEIIVGKSRFEAFGNSKPGIYVRRPSEVQTWLAVGPVDVPLDARDWVERKVFETDGNKIANLSWHAPGTPAKEIVKLKRTTGADATLAFEDVPTGKKVKTGESGDAIARSYTRLELDDVRKALAADKDTKTGQATLVTADGMAVVFDAHAKNDETWLAISAKGDGDAKAAADALNARVKGWQFKIAPGTAGQLFKPAADLFEANDAKG